MKSKIEHFKFLFISVLVILMVSYGQYISWKLTHQDHIGDLMAASDGVLNGTPHWRAFQNRLLAPTLVWLLSTFHHHPFMIFVGISLVGLNFCLFYMVKNHTKNNGYAFLSLILVSIFWVFLQDFWSYPWDFLEAFCLLFLAYSAIIESGISPVLIVFMVSLFNRESSVFFGLYILFCGLSAAWYGKYMRRKTIYYGLFMIVISIISTEIMRKYLFKGSMLPGIGLDNYHKTFENHFLLNENFENISSGFAIHIIKLKSLFAAFSLFLISSYFFYNGICRKNEYLTAIGLTFVLYFISIFVFGSITETRIYQPFCWSCAFLVSELTIRFRKTKT